MMHEQFNNEIPWIVGSHKFTNQKSSNNPLNKSDLNQSYTTPTYYNNAPQSYDFQKIEPMRQDISQVREEMRQMKADYDLANERFQTLKEKYDKLQSDYQKDKNFYEEALEARMNQLEQFEQENDVLNQKVDDARRRELDLIAKNE